MAFSYPRIRTAFDRRRLRLLLLSAILVSLASCATREPAPRAPVPRGGDVDLMGIEVRPVSDAILGNVSYDLPVVANNWVQAELEFLLNDRRSTVESWLRRGDPYQAFIQEVLRREGIPTDLYHVAMIESGFVPTARSPVGATGMWQFMPATSRDVGLRIDNSVDERIDPVRATRAAARYLRSLHRIHGDWALAAAAYNAGTGRISRSMQRIGARDFWDLAQRGDLAAETQHYVPRLYAMTIISRDRERFGFQRQAATTFAFDSVHVEHSVALEDLAVTGGISPALLREMNPHLIHARTPADGYWVWVPEGTGPQVQRAYLGTSLQRNQPSSTATYIVRWGDSLGRIAQRSDVEARRIRELNPGVDFDRLQTGAEIRLPPAAVERLAAAPAEPVGSTPAATAAAEPEPEEEFALPSTRPVLMTTAEVPPAPREHVVAPGEYLSGIASRYGVSLGALREANGISGSVIVPGQRLVIPGAAGERVAAAPPAPAASTPSAAATPPTASAPAPAPDPEPAPAPTQREATEHVVAAGETLGGIAQRYGTTVLAIREVNEVAGSVIVPGQRLTIPATGGAPEVAAAQPAAAMPPTAERQAIEHVVSAGETLGGIAQRYGTTVPAIRENNEIAGTVIVPGQRLRIVAAAAAQAATRTASPAAAPAPAPAPEREHLVAAGDNLTAIARRYGTTITAIRELNGIDGSVIRPGQRLRIPPDLGANGDPGEDAAVTTHVVEAGETLWGIAQRYGSSVGAIEQANELGSRPIIPGQRLSIPR